MKKRGKRNMEEAKKEMESEMMRGIEREGEGDRLQAGNTQNK